MSSHVELNPDDSTLGLSLGMKAMRLALTQKTHKMGTVRIPGTGGTDVIIGDGAQDGANRIDQDGNQLPLVDTSGIDKAAQDAQQSADKAMAKADEAIAKGEQIRRDAQAGIEDARKQAQAADAKADQVRTDLETAASQLESNIAAVDKKADQVRSDLTRQVQDAKSEMDSTVKAAQSSADKAQSAADAAQKAADKANASTADLDKSIQAVDAKAIAAKQAAAEAQSKAENVASDLDSANAVIEQHTTELGELTTKVSNAVKKSDSALSVSTEAKQTATEASTTATSAYKDSQTALTQSTTATQTATAAKTTAESAGKTASDSLKQSSAAVQTANQISTTLKTEYQTKADADKLYATQSSLKQTSDSITASVSKTYATKDALSTLQNVADNAIESWQGTGVPTLTNKPASDWTTDAKRKKHSGDLYYDKATGKAYRFGSDDGKTYTWELNQDTDVTKALADASKAQTSANNAQASATAANTAAGKAQSTANTAAANAATAKNAADAAQSSANKAQGDVDKLKIDIPATYATKSSLTQTAESITANVESVKTTANSAVTAASKAQQTADAISVNLTKNYQTKSQADTIYATKASLKATSDSISAEVTKAQGTADGAVTAASKAQQTADAVTLNLSKNYQTKAQNDALYATQTSLKATSDSLSANITANAKTAQSAVDKATSLEANLNGFKTTVSETYTTKTDFNNLTIGGTNRIVLTGVKPGRIDSVGNVGFDAAKNDHCYTVPVSAERNTKYTISGSITTPNGCYISVAFYDENGKFISRPIGAYSATEASWKYVFTSPANAVTMRSSFPVIFKGKIKLEKGTKPTDWSPAPEDLQPAGDYATNSSLTQTANSIKAQVTEVSKTANGAMSKATTVEQTANGLSSKITEQGKTLNATVKTANTAKATADSNKQTISQVKTTADGAVNRVSSLEQNLDGFKTSVAKTYQTKDGMSAYATTSALKQTSGSITAEVSKVSQTATGALNKATSVEQTANGLSTKITEQGKTLNATVKTANEAKHTADSNKTAISQTANLVDAALAGDNLITDGGFESTEWWKGLKTPFRISIGSFYHGKHVLVCDAATGDNRCPLTHEKGMAGTATTIPVTKGRTYRLSGYCAWYSPVPSNVNPSADKLRLAKPDGSFIAEAPCGKSMSWSETHVDWKCPDDGSITSVRIEVMHQANGSILWDDVAFRDITEAAETSNRVSSVQQNLDGFKTTVSNTYQTKAGMSSYATASHLTQTANQIRGEVSEKYQSKSGMSSYATTSALTQKADEITGKVSEVAKTATGAMGKASSVEQTASALSSKLSETVRTLDSTVQTVNTVKSTADSNKATLTQVAKTASDASSRASSVEQSLNGFKTTVSQTYGRGSNLWVNPTFDPDKPQITSRVNNVTAPNGSGVNLLASRDHYNNATSFPVVPGHTYVITAHAKKIKGDISLNAGIWYTAQTSGNAWDSIVHAESTSNLSDGWMAATWRFTCPNSKSRGCVYFQIGQCAGNISTQWYVSNVVCTDVTGLQPAGDYATKSYVNQNAKTIALGVVENYKGSDGSGLATKSDITVAKDSVTSTVASTYATKSGVTQEILSKITQNNNSLDVKFATKSETKTAQATANTAKSDASDAQSRVGTLEDCISLTSAGVRAGHQKNGVFNGVSALVNTDGSFDLLDKDGNLLTRIDRHSLQVAGDDGVGSGHLILSQDGLDITVQPTANKAVAYHIQLGAGGISITAPDGAHVECSARTGLDLETVKYGKLSIGSGGLQFTNDQGWGLGLSAAGWSLKWAGNHTLATGPAAGKLYIDGREIVTK